MNNPNSIVMDQWIDSLKGVFGLCGTVVLLGISRIQGLHEFFSDMASFATMCGGFAVAFYNIWLVRKNKKK